MTSEKARLVRLRRLERVRAIAKQTAAAEAAAAEGTLAQLTGLAAHTRRLTCEYGARREASNGESLRQLLGFIGGLTDLGHTTANDEQRARTYADTKLGELAAAERRRAAVEDRAVRQARDIAKAGNSPPTGSRRKFGTGLE